MRYAGLAVLACCCATGALAAEADWLARLQARLDGIGTFQARFVQEYEPKALSRRQSEGGSVTFRRPLLMRWEYEWPEDKLALCDGERVWVYYPREKRAEVDALSSLGDGAPVVQILLGRWRLAERFRLEGVGRRDGEVTLHLGPKDFPEGIRAVRVSLAEPDLALRALEVEEAGGNLLRYLFEDWTEGVEAPPGLFRFEPPAGVRVAGDAPEAGRP